MKILLPIKIILKGQCSGIMTTQVERTSYKALYRRSDNYWECFYIKVINERIFKGDTWTDTYNIKERYPKEEDFGVTAWCGRELSIRKTYEAMSVR